MSLDLNHTAAQIQEMASHLKARQSEWNVRLETALESLSEADTPALERKRLDSKGKVTWMVPGLQVQERLDARYPSAPLPGDFCVISVDGSHIDVDRHRAAHCYLINIGACTMTYGSHPDARLLSQPTLYAQEEELVIRDPQSGTKGQPVEGAILGMKRTIEEMRSLAHLLRELPPDIPTLALIDGSLIMWGLTGQGYPDYVRDALLVEGFLKAMDDVQSLARERTVALASYISLPRSTELVSALRLQVCPYETPDCDYYCGKIEAGQRPCDSVGGVLDRDILQQVLEPGERSALFASTSSVVEKYYGPHQVQFFYVNIGPEIGRVELPAWVAQDEALLSLIHSLIVDQCRRGQGYPVAIQEAHEQAVVTGADRELFQEMVDNALWGKRLAEYTSEKSRSKRVRWL